MYSADTVHSRYHSHLRKELSLRDMPWVIRIRWPPKTAYIAVFSFAGISCILYRSKLRSERGARFLQNERHCRSSHPEDLRSRHWVNPWWLVQALGDGLVARKASFVLFFMLLTFHNMTLSLTMRHWCFYQSFSVSCSQFTIFVETRDPFNRAIRTRPCTSSPKTRDPLLLSLFSFFPRKIGSHCDVSVVVWLRI
jgi:hypothetical protein